MSNDQLIALHELRDQKNRLSAFLIESRGRSDAYRAAIAAQLNDIAFEILEIQRGVYGSKKGAQS